MNTQIKKKLCCTRGAVAEVKGQEAQVGAGCLIGRARHYDVNGPCSFSDGGDRFGVRYTGHRLLVYLKLHRQEHQDP